MKVLGNLVKRQMASKVDQRQLDIFASAQRWEKSRKRLQSFAEKRATFIHNTSLSHFKISDKEFQDLAILDVGCGAGLLAEEIAKLGGKVRGIDPGKAQVSFARSYANTNPNISKNLVYEVASTDDIMKKMGMGIFDVVVCSQVVEHVPNYSLIVEDISKLLKVKLIHG